MQLCPFVHGMRGPRWSLHKVLWYFFSRDASPGVGVIHVESEGVFPYHHSPVRLRLLTLRALATPSNPLARACFKMGSNVSQQQQQIFADNCSSLLSAPPAALSEVYCHFVIATTTAAEAIFGPPDTPDTTPGLVSSAARVLHTLVRAHPRWWLRALVVRKVVAARRAVRQAWDVVGLECSLEVVPFPRRGGGGGRIAEVRLLGTSAQTVHVTH